MLPWRVKQTLRQIQAGFCDLRADFLRRLNAFQTPAKAIRIVFHIPEYEPTGGALAIAQVANLLAKVADVRFVARRFGPIQPYLNWRVKRIPRPDLDCDFCVAESGTPLESLRALRSHGVEVIVSNHGFPEGDGSSAIHGYDPADVLQAWDLANHLHALSPEQSTSLFENYPGFAAKVWLIPNVVPRVVARPLRGHIGIVGDATLPRKNVTSAIQCALGSRAVSIQVWGRSPSVKSESRVHWNGYSRDRERIYSSFGVLLSLSLAETQPLTVAEALSAGMPCVLSDLPCYGPELRQLPGVWIVDAQDPHCVKTALNEALDFQDHYTAERVQYWQRHHSPDAVLASWLARLSAKTRGDEHPAVGQVG